MKQDSFQLVTHKLNQLHKEHPSYGFGRIISIAFSEYGDIWGLTNKEALFALEKYEAELALDEDKIASPEYMDKLFKDVANFNHILDEEEDEDE